MATELADPTILSRSNTLGAVPRIRHRSFHSICNCIETGAARARPPSLIKQLNCEAQPTHIRAGTTFLLPRASSTIRRPYSHSCKSNRDSNAASVSKYQNSCCPNTSVASRFGDNCKAILSIPSPCSSIMHQAKARNLGRLCIITFVFRELCSSSLNQCRCDSTQEAFAIKLQINSDSLEPGKRFLISSASSVGVNFSRPKFFGSATGTNRNTMLLERSK